jgi:hypothetical protein
MIPFALTLVVLFAGLAFSFWRLASRFDVQQCTAEWLDTFSLERYAPMERLLNESDFAFLASQPGYREETGKRLRAERRKIFRGYLRSLVRDFNQLMRIGRMMVVFSAHDQQEFAHDLLRQQVKFYARVGALELKLVLYPLGWRGVDVRGLLASLGAMRARVQDLTMPAAPLGHMA